MRNASSLDFQNSIWEIVLSLRNRLPYRAGAMQQNLAATLTELETLKGCAEIMSNPSLVNACEAMSTVARSGIEGQLSAEAVTRDLMSHLDDSLILLCSQS